MNVDRAWRQERERTRGVGAKGTSSQVMLFLCAFCLLLPSCLVSWNEVNISCSKVRLSAWPLTWHARQYHIVYFISCGVRFISNLQKKRWGELADFRFEKCFTKSGLNIWANLKLPHFIWAFDKCWNYFHTRMENRYLHSVGWSIVIAYWNP